MKNQQKKREIRRKIILERGEIGNQYEKPAKRSKKSDEIRRKIILERSGIGNQYEKPAKRSVKPKGKSYWREVKEKNSMKTGKKEQEIGRNQKLGHKWSMGSIE